ncbi:MAG: hypothetical protein SO412_05405 [Erysipelotrichaceae bacterium]|nr:hypothetical protein [Erysipelotrichaceae bacterium]
MSEINEVKEKEMSEVSGGGGGGLGFQRKLTRARCRCGGRVYDLYCDGKYNYSACENGHKLGKLNSFKG